MDIVMPKMGESVNEGTIIKWHKKVGDAVEQDEIIFEISTDKVDTEIPSPAAGILQEIKYNEGDTVDVGTVVAIVDVNGETKTSAREEPKKTIQPQKSNPIVEEKKSESLQQQKSFSSEVTDIEMPKMGESVMEGTIIKWYKKVGDKVAKDETLFEISTDKVDTEVPSSVEGIVAEILVAEQETVEVGTIVAKISTGDYVPQSSPVLTQKQTQVLETIQEPESAHDNFSKQTIVEEKIPKGEAVGFYSPLVMSIAKKENISIDELGRITGSGLQGRVTKQDVLAFLENRTTSPMQTKKAEPISVQKPEQIAAPAPSFVPPDASTVQSGGGVERIPMDNIRQKIMDHMVASRDTSVHVSAMLEVDMNRIHNFINEKKNEYQKKNGVKLTYMAFISNACVKALKKYPLINSTLDGNTILKKHYINLGIAVAIEPTGLIVPNIKGADQLNIIGFAKAISDLAYKSRNKKLTPDDISGGTFTITNYGVFGTIFGTPIINQPEVAILGVGAVIKKPVVVNVDGADSIAIKPILALTLSHDHRLVDGMLGGMFLKEIKDTLENFNPESL